MKSEQEKFVRNLKKEKLFMIMKLLSAQTKVVTSAAQKILQFVKIVKMAIGLMEKSVNLAGMTAVSVQMPSHVINVEREHLMMVQLVLLVQIIARSALMDHLAKIAIGATRSKKMVLASTIVI